MPLVLQYSKIVVDFLHNDTQNKLQTPAKHTLYIVHSYLNTAQLV